MIKTYVSFFSGPSACFVTTIRSKAVGWYEFSFGEDALIISRVKASGKSVIRFHFLKIKIVKFTRYRSNIRRVMFS